MDELQQVVYTGRCEHLRLKVHVHLHKRQWQTLLAVTDFGQGLQTVSEPMK